jgi:hypothetical protein
MSMRCTVVGVLFFLVLVSPAYPEPLAGCTSNDDLTAELCRARSPCFIGKRTPAKDNTSRLRRELAYVVLGEKGSVWGQVPHWTGDGASSECVPYEVWLIEHQEQVAAPKRLLAELCNDGYGARGLGEDVFTLDSERVVYQQSGGSNWGWSNGATFNLNTAQFESSVNEGWFSGGRQQDRTHWDWSTFRGVTRWYVDQCDWYQTAQAKGEAVPIAESDFYRYRNMPQPDLPARYKEHLWQETSISNCALTVDSGGENGYVISGIPGKPTDAGFDVLAVDERTLIVEVRDDSFVTSKKSWLYGDHLEIWLAPRISISHCLEEVGAVHQWGIKMSDGAVIPAHGKPQLKIEVERMPVDSTTIRMKLTLPKNMPTFTLVYSDSDDGISQERLIATSDLKFGKVQSMGRMGDVINRKFGQCVLKDQSLVFERAVIKASVKQPVFSR